MGSSESEKIEAEVREEKSAGLLARKMEEGKQVALDAKKGKERGCSAVLLFFANSENRLLGPDCANEGSGLFPTLPMHSRLPGNPASPCPSSSWLPLLYPTLLSGLGSAGSCPK